MNNRDIRILHVDDNESFLDIAKRQFEALKSEIQVHTLSDPEKALGLLEENQFDCVLCDYKMSEINGIELLRRIREKYPELPFILLTSHGSEEVAGQAVAEDATDYIQKGSSRENYQLIVNRIENAVSRKKAKEERERAFNRMNDGYYALDEDCHFTYVNEAAEQILDRSREDLLGKNIWNVFPEAKDTEIYEKYYEAMEKQETVEFTTYYPTLDTWFSITAYPSETGLSVYFEDITEQRQRERQLSNLIENVPGMVYRCRNERGWPMEFVSDACKELTGYKPDELEDGEISWGGDIMVERDRDVVWESVQANIEENGAFSETYQIKTADGETRWVRDQGRGVSDEEGDLVKIEGIISDITERKRAEQRLEEERSMFAEGPAIVFRWEASAEEGWPVEYVSENVEDFLGYTPEELKSDDLPYMDLLLDEEIDRISREVEEASDDTTEWFSHEPYRIRTKTGEIRWVKDITKIIRDESGNITNYLGYLVDITERKRRERQLEESEQRYRTLIENFPNGAVALVDKNLNYQTVGGNTKNTANAAVEEIQDTPVEEAVPDKLAEELVPSYRAAIENGESSTFETELDNRIYRFQVVPVRDDDGEVFAALGMSQNITDQKKQEQELHESEQLYRTLAENLPEGAVGVYDHDLRYTLATGEKMGEDLPPAKRLEGDRMPDIFPENVAEDLEPIFRAAVEDGEKGSTTTKFRGRNWEVWAAPLRDENGEIYAGLSFAQDITEQKEREKELQRKKRRYEAMFEDPNILVGLLDPDGTVLDINQTAMDYIDADLDDITGEIFWETPWWGEDEEVQQQIKEWTEQAAEGEYVDFEIDLYGQDGEEHVISGYFRPVTDENGEVVSIIISDRDITERKERERRLRDAKAQLEAATEAASVGTWEWYIPENKFIAGPSLAKMFGVDPEEAREGVPLERFTSSVHEDDMERVERKIENAIENCGEYEAEYRVWDADDELRWVEARGHVECDEDGNPAIFPGAVTDITDRKQYERRLEESEQRHRTLAENFPNGIVTLFNHDFEYTLAAGQGFEKISAEPEDLEGRRFDEVWDEETTEKLKPAFKKALNGERGRVELEYQDREWIVYAVPITDEQGNVFAGMTMAQDITERKEYERQLERFKRMVETTNEMLYIVDDEGCVEWANQELADKLGYDLEEIIGKPSFEFARPQDHEKAEEIQENLETGEKSPLIEAELIKANDERFPVEARITPFEFSDGGIGRMGVIRDITERKQREERLKEFSSILSHDLKNPLTTAQGYLDLALESGQKEDDIRVAKRTLQKMENIIGDLQMITLRPSEVDKEEVSLENVFNEAYSMADVEADYNIGDIMLEAGRTGLTRLLTNLITNSVEHNEGYVNIEAGPLENERGFYYQDDGNGIPEDRREEVFKHGFTTSNTGHGLGLTIVKRIVEANEWEIECKESESGGVRFEIIVDN